MLNEVIISRNKSTILLSCPFYDKAGWVSSYLITLKETDLSASVRIENSIDGHNPSVFFSDLAKYWRGWEGEKLWSNIEGNFNFVATCNACGHIIITTRIRSGFYLTDWSAENSILVEAGQLNVIEKQVFNFFNIN